MPTVYPLDLTFVTKMILWVFAIKRKNKKAEKNQLNWCMWLYDVLQYFKA